MRRVMMDHHTRAATHDQKLAMPFDICIGSLYLHGRSATRWPGLTVGLFVVRRFPLLVGGTMAKIENEAARMDSR